VNYSFANFSQRHI